MDVKPRWADNIMIERWFRSLKAERISYLYDKSAIERRHKTEAHLAIIRQLPAKNILLFPA
jgi:transposase InsO family protein